MGFGRLLLGGLFLTAFEAQQFGLDCNLFEVPSLDKLPALGLAILGGPFGPPFCSGLGRPHEIMPDPPS